MPSPNTPTKTPADPLVQQAADLLLKAFGDHAGFRLTHAKGIVCHGTFQPAPAGAEICKAAHFRGGSLPIVVRFSNSTGLPEIPDSDPHSNPKGMAIRFQLPGGAITDIVANGLNGFSVGTPADFVGLLTAVTSTRPDSPKPTPVEKFMAAHPATLAYVSQPNLTPASFATQAYFGNNSFVFINAKGQKRPVRYQIIPLAGQQHLDDKAAAAKPVNFLFDEIRARLAKGVAEYRLLAQLADPGDPTDDATKVWPDTRKKVELGVLRLTSVDPDSAQAQRSLMYDPTHLTDGIELSDDPLPVFRAQVYSISIAHRMKKS